LALKELRAGLGSGLLLQEVAKHPGNGSSSYTVSSISALAVKKLVEVDVHVGSEVKKTHMG